MHFTGDDSYHNFLVFSPMLNSLTSESNNKKVTDWISTRISLEKVKLFGLVFSAIKFNLGKYRRILKTSNCFLVQKSSCSFPSNFILNFYIV